MADTVLPLTAVMVLPDFAAGGAQKVLLRFASELDRQTFAPHVIVLNASGPLRPFVSSELPTTLLNYKRVRVALLTLCLKLRAMQPSVIVSTMTYVNFAILLLKPLLHRGTRFVVREANLPSGHSRSRFGRLVYRLGYWALYRWADIIVCPARAIADELIANYGVQRACTAIISNPVDEDALRLSAAMPLRKCGVGRRFVAVGRLSYQKGYDRLLVDFAKLSPDSRLTIFGEGALRHSLERQVAALALEGRVDLPGFEPNPAPWIAGADALLLSSRWEGLPNVVLEALACGTPAIVTPESGGVAEVAAQAANGAIKIVASGDSFVAAMRDTPVRMDLSLRPSFLPDIYRMANAASAFTLLLSEICARPASKLA